MGRQIEIGRHWTDREIDRLRHLYPTAPWPNLLKAFPSRTKFAIQVQAIKFRIKRKINARTHWTGPEKNLLAKLYPVASWSEICGAMPRHPKKSIVKMANSLKIRRDHAKKRSVYPVIQKLREIRRDSNIDQLILADIVGCHRVQISYWERGDKVPRLRSFFDWIEALGYRIDLVPIDQVTQTSTERQP